jgi:polar amino acid transport system substrate-binding protein
MKGKKVGAQIGTTGAIEIAKHPDITLASYDEIGLAFEDLAIGRIDGIVADSPIAANFALQNAKFKEKLMIVGKPFTDEWLGMVTSKGNTKVMAILNDGLAKIKADGELEAIANKWLH